MECLDAIALSVGFALGYGVRRAFLAVAEVTGDVRFRDAALTVPPQALVVGPFLGSLYWPSPI